MQPESAMSQPDFLLDRIVSRRAVLRGGALAGVGAFLAACGTPAASTAPTATPAASGPAPTGEATPTASAAPQTPSAVLNFANWPLYIDEDDSSPPKSPTLEAFTAKYGTKVNYSEAINDNDQFFGTIQPPLRAGQDTGWDLMILTDWMAQRLIRLGWVEKIDRANTPNFVANENDIYRNLPWDPDNDLRAPWQSGMTGLGFDSAVTGELTAMADLWRDDPRWKGRVWFLTEMRDTVGLTLLKLGLKPESFTMDEAATAMAEIKKAVDAGIVRSFLGNDYKESLVKGDLVAGMTWSGDIIQAQPEKESLRFVIPTEGAVLWTDNMLIPKGAQHKYTAELMIDFVYDPKIAAQIAIYVQYVSPVKGAQEVIAANSDPAVAKLAKNPLMFPDEASRAQLHQFRAVTEEEETSLNDQFSTVEGN